MLTPMDINNRDFKRATIRGYKEDEVDEFLDRVVADYDKLFRENEKLKEQARLNEKEITQFRKLEKNLQDTLMVVQNTADEIITSAKKNSEEMRNNTERECQNMREQAQMEARRQLDDASSKLRTINSEYDRLIREKNAFLLKIRTALESELAVTNHLLSNIPQPTENESVVPVQSASITKSENESIKPMTPKTMPIESIKIESIKDESAGKIIK
ncbi:MAG: DivIVA domain-containing protein [Selenomonadaceae bacterium]|nr:DivIVA domain-containing protein [Selenomonadaceae bacterium]MBR1858117.1 DivIVA domain-containing protein [Selenomonadaceae bacterium]